jgi:nitrite reductase/ring-hydroxylating ferredoxin subunit
VEHFACKLDLLKQKQKLALKVNNLPILLAYTTKGIFAVRDKCPHMGSPLSNGILEDDIITCKFHGLPISLETGEVANQKKAEYLKLDEYSRSIRTYKTVVKENSVYIII